MKEEIRWKLYAAIVLVTLTLLLMTIHLLVFQDPHYLFIHFLMDLAFVPIEFLCVTLILDRLLSSRERHQRLEKLNMVIGIFFSRAGIPLLTRFIRADPCAGPLPLPPNGGTGWNTKEFQALFTSVSTRQCVMDPALIDRESLREFLLLNEDFLLRIVENPTVFEHESFTDLILAVTHLTEELKASGDLSQLPPSDVAHIKGDMERVYSRLVPEWLKYMEYLHRTYPYLFSLAIRTNPFDAGAKVIMEK